MTAPHGDIGHLGAEQDVHLRRRRGVHGCRCPEKAFDLQGRAVGCGDSADCDGPSLRAGSRRRYRRGCTGSLRRRDSRRIDFGCGCARCAVAGEQGDDYGQQRDHRRRSAEQQGGVSGRCDRVRAGRVIVRVPARRRRTVGRSAGTLRRHAGLRLREADHGVLDCGMNHSVRAAGRCLSPPAVSGRQPLTAACARRASAVSSRAAGSAG